MLLVLLLSVVSLEKGFIHLMSALCQLLRAQSQSEPEIPLLPWQIKDELNPANMFAKYCRS